MTEIDYDTWNYWFAFYLDETRGKMSYVITRTPETIDMMSMMQTFIKKQPKMEFKPVNLLMGRMLDSQKGHQYYDQDQYAEALQALLKNDKQLVADVCAVKLVEAKSKEEFQRYQLHYNTFDQLDNLIKSQRKKKN